MRGWFVQQRHYLARFAARYPRTTVLAIRVRKWFWWLVGWPFTVAALWMIRLTLIAGLLVWLIPVGLFTTAWTFAVSVVTAWPGGQDGVLLAGAVLAAIAYGIWWYQNNVGTDVWGLVKKVWRYAGRTMLAVNAALVLNPILVASGFLLFWVALAVDLANAAVSRQAALLRSYAEFRRELPDHWTDLAARSKRVQSIDVGLERTVSEAANERPILEHPGLGGLLDTRFNVDEFKVTIPVARLEGRSLEALEEVIDELAAQYFSIGDGLDSIKLIATTPVRSNFASWAWLEVRFKPPATRPQLPWHRVFEAIGDLFFGTGAQVRRA